MVNWILIVCGIFGMMGAGLFHYIINSYILGSPLETPDSEQWSNVYILLVGFASFGLVFVGIFTKQEKSSA